MPTALQPGLLILHGNRLEQLAEAVFAWLARHPLHGLEEEVVLVQSNGMAEWLKMALAAAHGVCAATRVELPARFVWRAYRAVLGPGAVPSLSALDKLPLTWRLMRLLPGLASQPGFDPVAGFHDRGDAARCLQLAQRLADLFDQYQVHRGDWLHDWAQGDDRLRAAGESPGLAGARSARTPVPPDQRWQPALWRALLAELPPDEREATRTALHRRFLAALGTPSPTSRPWAGLPRRVVLFGTTHIPQQTLEAIAALSAHVQVLMAVPNPCRYHWADTVEGRELLRAARRRHPLRAGIDLAPLPLQDMHAHGHPLLSAWGRQSRDFVRLLDVFDDVQQARARFEAPRVDLFDDAPGATLLEQLQANIRDLVPLAEQTPGAPADADRSVVFHVAHSAQREVEIVHDQLLQLLAHPPGGRALHPRDIVVMLPDVDAFAPAVRSVFGQHPPGHPRHVPWGIADQRDRGHAPLLVALEWLLHAARQRFTFSQLRDLLDVPAVARRFGLQPDDVATLVGWIEGAGVRWGLHAPHRASLGLGACGDVNGWRFGLRRMLLGYATGVLDAGHAGIEPHAEVAGLEAGLAGALAELVDVLDAWWDDARAPRTPTAWGLRLRQLLGQVFDADADAERALLAALDDALADWLQGCETAAFDAPVDVAVVAEAWLGAVDAPGVSRRFRAGGVTFCTLLPLRAIPFEVVCLLGMNDGDYPRRGVRSDFDLMALPGQARPGDRSRRDDDRQLMLDAVLSARRVLYVSWAGRSQRDNEPQPPSVLVSQLRDHLAAGWDARTVAERTTEHPLQPFSRRYFEAGVEAGSDAATNGRGLYTYADEWRSAHDGADPAAAPHAAPIAAPFAAPSAAPVAAPSAASTAAPIAAVDGPEFACAPLELNFQRLAAFLRNPVKAFFAERLQTRFDEREAATPDDESFTVGGLDRWQLLDEVLRAARAEIDAAPATCARAPAQVVAAGVARLRRAGRLPVAAPGAAVEEALFETLAPMVAHWTTLDAWPRHGAATVSLHLADPDRPGLVFADVLGGLRSCPGAPGPVWIELLASRLVDEKRDRKTGQTTLGAPRPRMLLHAWLRSLASAACGLPAGGVVIGANAVVRVAPLDPAQARLDLLRLMRASQRGLTGDRPLATAVRTGVAFVGQGDPRAAYEGRDTANTTGEVRDACLARLYPDYAALAADPTFAEASMALYAAYGDWLGRHVQVEPLPGHRARDADETDGDG